MLYKNEEFPQYVRTAGKITIVSALAGFMVFMFALVFDFGAQEFSRVSAQTGRATTTLTVLNTPPSFTLNAYEVIESSTTTPTNSGDVIQWSAIGTDTNSAPYFLLICDTNATPTPGQAAGLGFLGTAAPACNGSAQQWGVSASTTSGELATASLTTTEGGIMGEVNNWFAWVCDDDPTNPRCNDIPVQGFSATNTSPFHVNSRPVFNAFANDGPVDPGGTLNFFSTSTDPDVVGGEDDIFLVVCTTNTSYNALTNDCDSGFFLASTSIGVTFDAGAVEVLEAIVQDDLYDGFGYIVDEHGHEASANPFSADFTVNNVAPTVSGGDIDLNGGANLVLNIPAGETTGFTLDFSIRDANSCVTAASSSEITNYTAAVFRSSIGTTTCDGSAGVHDENNCYSSGVGTAVWNLVCTQTSSCPDDASVDQVDYSCTFPLWFVSEPTDAVATTPTIFSDDHWTAGIAGIDDDNATGTMATTSTNSIELIQFSAIDIVEAEIVFGGVEPGTFTANLVATSTALSVGNTGLDQGVRGSSMCGTYTASTLCPVEPTSTIPASEQRVSSTSVPYGDVLALTLASTSDIEIELDIEKTTSTTTPNRADTYWGIAVPASITLAGDYTGLNEFIAIVAEALDWQ